MCLLSNWNLLFQFLMKPDHEHLHCRWGKDLWSSRWKLHFFSLFLRSEHFIDPAENLQVCSCRVFSFSLRKSERNIKEVDFQQRRRRRRLCVPEASSSVLNAPPCCSSNCCKLSEHYRPLHALWIKHSPICLPRRPGKVETFYLLGSLWRFRRSDLFFWNKSKLVATARTIQEMFFQILNFNYCH